MINFYQTSHKKFDYIKTAHEKFTFGLYVIGIHQEVFTPVSSIIQALFQMLYWFIKKYRCPLWHFNLDFHFHCHLFFENCAEKKIFEFLQRKMKRNHGHYSIYGQPLLSPKIWCSFKNLSEEWKSLNKIYFTANFSKT